jgi:four helix bundle protein
MSVRSYRDLTVWQAGVALVEAVYSLTQEFPKSEVFGLSSQMQRAAISIPSNIAEGHARVSRKEFLHFLSISLGSLAELETQLFLAQRLKYVTQEELAATLLKTEELGRMIRGLQKVLQSKTRD